ncbi:flavodoxin family protein [Clostridium estertheticum]|uniref:flavodoxin family protein n=1 Tax=Clostridium estertheticum TaxID=238834 RepID=UPI001C7D0D6B|nr:flavodoxin family protein [Clostridium estertheticum]MBX4262901.1 flavodoxin family protein [Clostridium estertheticum]WLC68621.1 flavodoxin family protein [Clostridium estertheticum]
MKVLIHDLIEGELLNLFPNISKEIKIVTQEEEIKKCIGCFGCWVKTPGSCVIKDGYGDVGKILGESEELIIISRICYGGFSPFVKNILDRNIGYLLPFFTIRNNEVHHESRYKKRFKLSVIAYGNDVTQKEKDTLSKLVIANGINFNVTKPSVCFADSINDIPRLREIL